MNLLLNAPTHNDPGDNDTMTVWLVFSKRLQHVCTTTSTLTLHGGPVTYACCTSSDIYLVYEHRWKHASEIPWWQILEESVPPRITFNRNWFALSKLSLCLPLFWTVPLKCDRRAVLFHLAFYFWMSSSDIDKNTRVFVIVFSHGSLLSKHILKCLNPVLNGARLSMCQYPLFIFGQTSYKSQVTGSSGPEPSSFLFSC